MAVNINQSNSEIYFGDLKVVTAAVYPGDVVVPNYVTGDCNAPASDGAADLGGLALVCNYDPYADTDMTNSSAYDVHIGEYARLKALLVGDVITTDRFIGTYSAITVGDIFAVNGTTGTGSLGKWVAIGVRTSALQAVVVEKTTLYGNNALMLRIIAA